MPLHAHPTRGWARRHLGPPVGKTEAWIILDAPGDGSEPAYAGIGFTAGIDRDWFAAAVRRHDNRAVRGTLHRTDVHPGEAYVARGGASLPRAADLVHRGPGAQRPHRDPGDDDVGATLGLGWDLALDMIDYTGEGFMDGDFGSQPIRRGETFALPASLPFRVRAGREQVRVVRCLGPDPV